MKQKNLRNLSHKSFSKVIRVKGNQKSQQTIFMLSRDTWIFAPK